MFSQFLPRRLSPAGCRVVGQSLPSRIAQWQADGKTLPREVTNAVVKVEQKTSAIDLLNLNRNQMPALDRATDSVVSAYHNTIEGYSKLPQLFEEIPPAPTILKRAEAANVILRAYFPKGISPVIHAPYDTQWALLNAIQTELIKPENQAKLDTLGLQEETQYLFRFIDLYGSRLGITKTEGVQVDPIGQASLAWHNAFGEFYVEITRAFSDDQNPEHKAAREFFLGAYNKRVERERLKSQANRTPTDDDSSTEDDTL